MRGELLLTPTDLNRLVLTACRTYLYIETTGRAAIFAIVVKVDVDPIRGRLRLVLFFGFWFLFFSFAVVPRASGLCTVSSFASSLLLFFSYLLYLRKVYEQMNLLFVWFRRHPCSCYRARVRRCFSSLGKKNG